MLKNKKKLILIKKKINKRGVLGDQKQRRRMNY
jgi:hypothetical protein